MKLKWNARTPIGLDVGARTIGAVQLHGGGAGGAGGGRSWRVEAATSITRRMTGADGDGGSGGGGGVPTSDELGQLAAALYRQGFTGNRVVLVAPESALFSTTMELPPRSSGAPIEELARQELARSAKRDVGTIEMSSWDVPAPPRAAEGTHLLAVGLAHEDAEAILGSFEGAGFEVEALDCRCCAMARACAAVAGGGGSHVSSIVDLTDAGVSIAIVHSGIVAYNRPIGEAGLARMRERLCGELHVDAEAADYLIEVLGRRGDGEGVEASGAGGAAEVQGSEGGGGGGGGSAGDETTIRAASRVMDEFLGALVQELRSVMAYAIHRYPGAIGPVLLTGPGASLRGLHSRIRAELDLEVRAVSLADVAQCAPELGAQGRDPSLTTAAGIAMHAVGGAWRGGRRAA